MQSEILPIIQRMTDEDNLEGEEFEVFMQLKAVEKQLKQTLPALQKMSGFQEKFEEIVLEGGDWQGYTLSSYPKVTYDFKQDKVCADLLEEVSARKKLITQATQQDEKGRKDTICDPDGVIVEPVGIKSMTQVYKVETKK